MKRIVYIWVSGVILAGVLGLSAGAQDQPLGDYARSVRKDKEKEKQQPAAKKYDNDTLPHDDKLSIVGPAPEEPADKPADVANSDQANAAQKPAAPADDRQKSNDQWKQKVDTQKNQIDLLSRELDVLQREYRLRAAAVYGDVGDRLRNSAQWDKEDQQYKQQIADKQKALDAAKEQLDDTQEQARKAGAPPAARE